MESVESNPHEKNTNSQPFDSIKRFNQMLSKHISEEPSSNHRHTLDEPSNTSETPDVPVLT